MFYAQAGVCRVVDIGPLDRVPDARAGLYYTLEVVGEPGRVFVPVDTTAYLRPVLTYEEAQALLREIPSLSVDLSGGSLRQWEDRYRAMVKSHSCRELAVALGITQEGAAALVEERLHPVQKGKFLQREESVVY